jgi:hypothetical protein
MADYTGFQILFKAIFLIFIIYLIYYIAMNVDPEWSVLILTGYIHCLFCYLTFFPVT